MESAQLTVKLCQSENGRRGEIFLGGGGSNVRKVDFLSFSFWQVAIKATLFSFENTKTGVLGEKSLKRQAK